MKREEAYQVFELSPNASEDEVKKKYRDLSKRYHPDVCKDADASDKIKKINEAYNRIKNQDFEMEAPAGFSGFRGNPFGGFGINIEDLINGNPFGNAGPRPKSVNLSQIELNTLISFKESVFGCKKDLTFKRRVKCEDCDGAGHIALNNGCTVCNGVGRVVRQQGNMIMTSTCNKCFGKVSSQPCSSCSSEGSVESQVSISVNIPPGIVNNNVLRLSNIGHFMGSSPLGDRYTDVYVHVQVIQDPNFTLKDNDLVTSISISMLEAIEGCSKSVTTLEGDKDIEIPPMSKNKDEVVLPKLGVARQGSQIVTINVEYPQEIHKFKEALKGMC